MKKVKELLDFVHNLEKSVDLNLADTRRAEAYIKKYNESGDKFYDDIIQEFYDEHGVQLKVEEANLIFLTTVKMEWSRAEKIENEGYLSGMFCFNSMDDLFSKKESAFWKHSVDKFHQIEGKSCDKDLLHKLRWIESNSSNPRSGTSPQYACAKFRESFLPNEFYFFDNGLVFNLPFQSHDDYIKGLVSSAAVKAWQYFYVNPEELVLRNKGLKYITWTVKTSTLDERLNDLEFNTSLKFDRLDLLAEYMERCIRLLPSTFPFIDFTYHINHYNKFKLLYDELKQK